MLIILVAHRAEADPFIDHYQMVSDRDVSGGRRFIAERVTLVITGQGPDNAGESVTRELARQPSGSNANWLNVGVAGSAEFDLGQIVQVSAVVDGICGDATKITLQTEGRFPVAVCSSFDTPQSLYPQKGVVDMEAHAIVSLISAHCGMANLQVWKLVIDGPQTPLAGLDRQSFKRAIDVARSTLVTISDKLA